MSNPFIGEIRMFAGSFAPAGWAFCDGQLMPIAENDALFTLIGTTYGGDGQETFGLPDLQGRIPMHVGGTHTLGEKGGVETVTLTTSQIPAHTHAALGFGAAGNNQDPTGHIWAGPTTGVNLYSNIAPIISMAATAIGPTGGSQPHDNMHPYLALSFILSLFGVFPSQT